MSADNEKTIISDSSYVSISLIIALCGGIIGAAAFITKINFQTNANAQTITELKIDVKEQLRDLKQDVKEIRKILEHKK